MRARLRLETEQGPPVVYELHPGEPVTLGRNRNNSIVLQDEHASRWHAEIFYENGAWFIRDLGTRNGTKINNERIDRQARLAHGQIISIGTSRLRFIADAVDNGAAAIEATSADSAGSSVGDSTLLQADALTVLCTFMAACVEESDPRALVRRALQTVHSQTKATVTGFLSLDPADPLPKMVWPELARVDVQLSRHLTQQVQGDGRPVWLHPAGRTPAGEFESLMLFTDALCLPLRADGAALGALHVYKSGQHFRDSDLRFCEILSGYLANSLRLLRMRRTLEAENLRLRGRAPLSEEIIGDSPAMQRLRQLVARAAPLSATVLITGESGVGKELVALAVHRQSPRRHGPLVVLNCAAIASSLLEAELFGYRKGAFTGAERDHPGLFEQADEGTLLLDEVGELPADCQAKLLRVIEGKGFRPVGGTTEIHTDVRVVAATHRDLERDVQAGRFRQDLYFRLQVIPIPVPPLREHAEDIPALVHYFLGKLDAGLHRALTITEAAVRRLQEYSWPGNVRQLCSVLEYSAAMSDRDRLDIGDLMLPADMAPNLPPSLNLEELETWAIRQALRRSAGNITQAARLLGIVRDTLAAKIKKKGINAREQVE